MGMLAGNLWILSSYIIHRNGVVPDQLVLSLLQSLISSIAKEQWGTKHARTRVGTLLEHPFRGGTVARTPLSAL